MFLIQIFKERMIIMSDEQDTEISLEKLGRAINTLHGAISALDKRQSSLNPLGLILGASRREKKYLSAWAKAADALVAAGRIHLSHPYDSSHTQTLQIATGFIEGTKPTRLPNGKLVTALHARILSQPKT